MTEKAKIPTTPTIFECACGKRFNKVAANFNYHKMNCGAAQKAVYEGDKEAEDRFKKNWRAPRPKKRPPAPAPVAQPAALAPTAPVAEPVAVQPTKPVDPSVTSDGPVVPSTTAAQ